MTITTTDRAQSAKTQAKRPNKQQSGTNLEMRVGFFTCVAVIGCLWGWGWLHSLSLFHPPQRFKVKFHDIAGLNKNAPVNINGVRVGTVETITLMKPHDAEDRAYVLTGLRINTEDIRIPHGSAFTIQTLGLVGAKYLEITLPEKPTAEDDVISNKEIIEGEDPVRVELVVNKIATNLASIDYSSAEHQLSQDMERVAKAADGVKQVTEKFGKFADNAQTATNNVNEFFTRGKDSWGKLNSSLAHINGASDNVGSLAKRINKVLPDTTSDLKEIVDAARTASVNIRAAADQLNKTVSDKGTRGDVLTMLSKANTTAESIAQSVKGLQQIANDPSLRTDIKKAAADAREAMEHFSSVVGQGDFKNNLSGTMSQVNSAAVRLNVVSDQLNQILGKRAPLWHMMVGKPGAMTKEDAERIKKLQEIQQKTLKETKKTQEKLERLQADQENGTNSTVNQGSDSGQAPVPQAPAPASEKEQTR